MKQARRRQDERLAEALAERKMLIVCGSGGVGKTTTAAALGLRAARLGRRVLVCTVDPSRRLATSLGLRRLSGEPRPLTLPRPLTSEDAQDTPTPGCLWAMTLDTKRTFDALVQRYAPDQARRRRILENRFYREVSSALAGSHEYMAMEQLLDLKLDTRFDLVVLDTPPTRHALDFLEAPDRLLAFLDTSILRFFLKPYFAAGRLTLKIATHTGAVALRLADRFLGLQFLQDLSEFFLAFEGMYEGFKTRAAEVFALLRSPEAGFVLVTSPAPRSLDDGLSFYERLRAKEMPFVSFVVNRVRPTPGRPAGGPCPAELPGENLAAALVQVYEEQKALARKDRRQLARLGAETEHSIVPVPELDTDVHDMKGLEKVGEALLGPRRRPPRRRRNRAHTEPKP